MYSAVARNVYMIAKLIGVKPHYLGAWSRAEYVQ